MADMKEMFPRGTIVRLKSGSPQITVIDHEQVEGEIVILVKWFRDAGSDFMNASFCPGSLEVMISNG